MVLLAAGLGINDLKVSPAAEPGSLAAPSEDKIGRPVRIVSIGFTQGHSLEEIAGLVDIEGARGTDSTAAETWRGQDQKSQDTYAYSY